MATVTEEIQHGALLSINSTSNLYIHSTIITRGMFIVNHHKILHVFKRVNLMYEYAIGAITPHNVYNSDSTTMQCLQKPLC